MDNTGTDDSGTWSTEAVKALIQLYGDNQNDMENGLTKKKLVWKAITQELHNLGHFFPQNKVECKWRYLVAQYQKFIQNKKTTGGKRITFLYFDAMDNILSKRHDIKPPMVTGTGCVAQAFSSQQQKRSEVNRSATDEGEGESPSTDAKRKKRKSEEKEADSAMLTFLKEMELSRKEESQKREENREKRAQERNNLLKEFLNIMSNDK